MGQSSSKKDFKVDNSKETFKHGGSIKIKTIGSSSTASGMSNLGSRTSAGLQKQPVSVVIDDNAVAMTTNQPQSNSEVSYRFRLLFLSFSVRHPYLFHSCVCVLFRPTGFTTLDGLFQACDDLSCMTHVHEIVSTGRVASTQHI